MVSISLQGRSLLLACIYHPPGSCTCNFQEEFISFVGFLSSINCSYYICGDFNIHVDVPVGNGNKFMTFLDSCNLKQSINKPAHPPVIRILIVDFRFVSNHPLVKCTIAFPRQVAHIPNKDQYRRYHSINMPDFCSDLKNTYFVKSTADAVVDFYEQYVHDLGNVLDRHAPLLSRLTKKDSLGANLRELGVGPKIHLTEVDFFIRLLSSMHL